MWEGPLMAKAYFNPQNVPEGLRREPRWICWNLEQRGGRNTKVPKDPKTGRNASSTDPNTWTTFDQAVAAFQGGSFSGVGFIFAPDRKYTGLDLDHVLLSDGTLDPDYRPIVEEAGTYTEISPSGDGLHLIFLGSKPEGATKCRKNHNSGRVTEMYDHDRFFTVTGNSFYGVTPLPPNEVRPNPAIVERAYWQLIDPEGYGAQPTLNQAQLQRYQDESSSLPDDEVIRRMLGSRSGSSVKALMDGDTGAYGGDDSAADLALCNHLAFWCAGDAGQMDRIFRRSGLMRSKWDTNRGGSTYGQQTIGKALEHATDFYRPRRRREQRDQQARRNDAQGYQTGGQSPSVTQAAPIENKRSIARAGDLPQGYDGRGAPSFDSWYVDEAGTLWNVNQEGELRYSVTSTAPWISADLIDVDTEDVRALVCVVIAGKRQERAIDRAVLLNQPKIVGALAPIGANVTSTNAKEVVRYLTEAERRFGRMRPRLRSVTHLGWADGPLGLFMPYDLGGEIRFDPTPDEKVKARPFLEARGTLEEWVAGIAPARAQSMAFRALLAASFASPLVALLDVQTFIVYLWGRSRSGKTPTLKAAGSIWGDPTEGSDSYFRTFADTPKSIVRAAALLHDIPIIVDELQSKGSPGGQSGKRMIVEDLLYSLSLGHERGALNSDRSMMHVGSWRALTIATGEIPIVGDSTQQGAANRTLEINAEPFEDVRQAQSMHHLVAEQHGTAGRTFIDALRRNGMDFYQSEFKRIRDAVEDVAVGHPQADNVALLTFADSLAEFYVFSAGSDWNADVQAAMGLAQWLLRNTRDAEGGDTDFKAIQYVSEWLARNQTHFESDCEDHGVDRYGDTERHANQVGFDWYVFNSVLSEALDRANYDRQKTLRRMVDEKIVLPGTRGLTRQRRFRNKQRVYCICIDNVSLEKFLEGPTARLDGLASEPKR